MLQFVFAAWLAQPGLHPEGMRQAGRLQAQAEALNPFA
jgi:hypothetical protein